MAVNPRESEPTPEPRPDLRIVSGAIATEQTVEVRPSVADMSEDDFRAYIHGLAQTGDISTQLELLKDAGRALSAPIAELTVAMSEMATELDQLYKRKVWIEGYIYDRLSPEYKAQLRQR